MNEHLLPFFHKTIFFTYSPLLTAFSYPPWMTKASRFLAVLCIANIKTLPVFLFFSPLPSALNRDETEDDLSELQSEAVPDEVRKWLASTFAKQEPPTRRSQERPSFKSVANAIRTGIFIERIYRRMSSSQLMVIPPEVQKCLKVREYYVTLGWNSFFILWHKRFQAKIESYLLRSVFTRSWGLTPLFRYVTGYPLGLVKALMGMYMLALCLPYSIV